MMLALRSSLAGLLVVISLIVALAATGLAHHAPSSADLGKQAFLLSGGSMGDLCTDMDDDSAPPADDCQACHLVGSAIVPTTDLPLLQAELAFQAKVTAPRESRALRVVRDPALGLRAPPIA